MNRSPERTRLPQRPNAKLAAWLAVVGLAGAAQADRLDVSKAGFTVTQAQGRPVGTKRIVEFDSLTDYQAGVQSLDLPWGDVKVLCEGAGNDLGTVDLSGNPATGALAHPQNGIASGVNGVKYSIAVDVTDFMPVDRDGDGLVDEDRSVGMSETRAGTDPLVSDTDNDGLLDGSEVNVHGTDPLDPDTNGDGFTDGENVTRGENPQGGVDSDGDGLSDLKEVSAGTNIMQADSDGGGAPDFSELRIDRTNPLVPVDDIMSGGANDSGFPSAIEAPADCLPTFSQTPYIETPVIPPNTSTTLHIPIKGGNPAYKINIERPMIHPSIVFSSEIVDIDTNKEDIEIGITCGSIVTGGTFSVKITGPDGTESSIVDGIGFTCFE